LALAREGKLQEAVSYFQKSLQMAPTASSYNNLGLALDQLNRRQEATQNFRLALQLDPNLAMAHFNLARCLEAGRDYAGARQHYGEAFRLNPRDTEAAQSLERLKSR
jgi:tetratricopeptide (TPR) repeat protein